MTPVLFGLLVTAIGLIGTIALEDRPTSVWTWIMKPLASTGFVYLALVCGANGSLYGQLVLAALAFSWLGDVLLIPKGAKGAFLGGLIAFLLGHVAFGVAFVARGVDGTAALLTLAVVAVPAGLVGRYFVSRAPPKMRVPVVAYVSVITVMVALALGTTVLHGDLRIAIAAVLFFASDLFVARQRFLGPHPINRLVGLPLYYGAQVIFAFTVAGPA